MTCSSIIKKVHRAARAALAGFAVFAALLGYPGAEHHNPPAASVLAAAASQPGTPSSARLLAAALRSAAFAAIPSGHSSVAGILAPQVFGGMFAQATFDAALESFLGFISKILLLLGVAVVFYGGWMVSQGKSSEGVLAILGGFIIAAAIPIVKLLAQFTGATF